MPYPGVFDREAAADRIRARDAALTERHDPPTTPDAQAPAADSA